VRASAGTKAGGIAGLRLGRGQGGCQRDDLMRKAGRSLRGDGELPGSSRFFLGSLGCSVG
jgi:hypothetical protein